MNRKWVVFTAVFLASIAVAMNQFKVPPIMSDVMEALNINMVTGGWLMSIYSVTVMILVIPAALILSKLGEKKTGLIALGFATIGSALGALASSTGMLLFGRCIEGIGQGLVAVVAPTVISKWFDENERGLPMGIWGGWIPIAVLVIFNVAKPIENAIGWQGVWWLTAAFAAFCFIFYALVLSGSSEQAVEQEESQLSSEQQGSGFAVLRNPAVWMLIIIFFGSGFRDLGYTTWAPTFYADAYGISESISNFYSSLSYLGLLIGSIVIGWVLDRGVKHRVVLLTASVITVLLATQCFIIKPSLIPIFMLVLGFVTGGLVCAIFALTPMVVSSFAEVSMGMACVNLGCFIGHLTAPPISGAVISQHGWVAGTYPVVIAAIVMVLASLLLFKFRGPRESI